MNIPVVFLLLAAGLEAVLSVDKYFEFGGKLSLKPESVPKEGITVIIWKHKGNFVAEWIKDSVPLNYFGDFDGRTELDTITGELTIRSMTKTDEGIFSVEVNSKAQTVEYSAREITHLRDKKVEALKRPVACTFSSPQCNLSCLADVDDAGPVEYFWQQDEGSWKKSDKNIIINNNEKTQLIKTFSCRIKNPISEKDSEPLENPFNKNSEEQSNDNAGLVGGVIVLVLLILGGVALSVFAYKHPEKIVPCLPCVAGHSDQHRTDEPPDDGEKGTSGRTQAGTVTFNGTPTPEHNESSVTVHLNIVANTETSSQTPPKPDEKTPLKVPETVNSNGTPTPQHNESSVTVHPHTEANTETSSQTPSEPDEMTPLTHSETSNLPDES